MSVSASSMEKDGSQLVADSWTWINRTTHDIDLLKNGAKAHEPHISADNLVSLKEHMVSVVHRHEFLELVVKGLTFMEQHDAQAYAKFVQKKRKLEDMDLEELRVLLR